MSEDVHTAGLNGDRFLFLKYILKDVLQRSVDLVKMGSPNSIITIVGKI